MEVVLRLAHMNIWKNFTYLVMEVHVSKCLRNQTLV